MTDTYYSAVMFLQPSKLKPEQIKRDGRHIMIIIGRTSPNAVAAINQRDGRAPKSQCPYTYIIWRDDDDYVWV